MESFTRLLRDIKDNYYDGLIVTGAPVEKMDFEEVDHWEEIDPGLWMGQGSCFSTPAPLLGSPGWSVPPLRDSKSWALWQIIRHLWPGSGASWESSHERFDDRFLAPHSAIPIFLWRKFWKRVIFKWSLRGNEVGLSIIASPDMQWGV